MHDEHVVRPAGERDVVAVCERHDVVSDVRVHVLLQRRRVQREPRGAHLPETSHRVDVAAAGRLRRLRRHPSRALVGRHGATGLLVLY